jgi:NADH-quinone oxidoreductase subunit L
MENWMSHQLEPVILRPNFSTLHHDTEWMLMGLAVAGAVAVIYFTYLLFMKHGVEPAAKEELLKPWQRTIYNKYYVDEIYDAVFRKPLDFLSGAFHKFLDVQFIDAIVNGFGRLVTAFGNTIRLLQNGNIGFYVVSMVMGVVLIILLTFLVK